MYQLLVLLFIIVFPQISWSQLDATIQIDTLKINYKTGGTLDSVDRISLVYPNSFSTNNFQDFQFLDAVSRQAVSSYLAVGSLCSTFFV